jgi:hypothetical protein
VSRQPIRDWRDLLELVFGERPDPLPEPWVLWPELTATLLGAELRRPLSVSDTPGGGTRVDRSVLIV